MAVIISPWVDANLLAFPPVSDTPPLQDSEFWVVMVVDSLGNSIFQSRELTLSELSTFEKSFDYRATQGTFYLSLVNVLTVGGAKTATSFPNVTLPGKYKKLNRANGKTRIVVNGKDVAKTATGLKSRSMSGRKLSSPISNTSQSSKPLRPNPEIEYQPYFSVWETKPNSTSPWTITSTAKVYQKYIRSWSGVRTPGFGSMRKRQLPVNPHTVSLRRTPDNRALSVQGWTENDSKFVETDLHTLRYSGAPQPIHNVSAINKAVRRLIDGGGLAIDANLAQDFAQMNQTVRLIGDNAKKIAQSIIFLKRGDIASAGNTLFGSARQRYRKRGGPSATKGLADNWLELQYGWKPLLMDIHGTMASLGTFNKPADLVRRLTSSATTTTESSTIYSSAANPGDGAGRLHVVRKTSARLVLRYKLDDQLLSFVQQLGFTNPVNLLWEILPFSFVVDWFLPIGPFLETLSSFHGLSFIDGSQTLFTRQTTDSALSYSKTKIGGGTGFNNGKSSYHDYWILLNRERLTAFPGGKFPEVKNGLKSLTHAKNGLALLISIFGK